MDWTWLLAVFILLMIGIFVVIVALRIANQYSSIPSSSNGVQFNGILSPCLVDTDCQAGLSCDTYNYTCKYQNGEDCSSGAQCLITSVCSNVCVPAGDSSFNSPCPCDSITSCVSSYEVAVCKYDAGQPCQADDDCASFNCLNNVCSTVTPDGYSCASNSDCSSSSECSGGFCQPLGVSSGMPGSACVDTNCTGSQRTGSTCSVGTCLCSSGVGTCGTASYLFDSCSSSASCYSDFSCLTVGSSIGPVCTLNPSDASLITSGNTCPPNAFRKSGNTCETNTGFTCINNSDCVSGSCQGGKMMASYYDFTGTPTGINALFNQVSRVDLAQFVGAGFNGSASPIPYPQYSFSSPLKASLTYNWFRGGGSYLLFSDDNAAALFYFESTSTLTAANLSQGPITTLLGGNFFFNNNYVTYLNQNLPASINTETIQEVISVSLMGDTNTLTFYASNFTNENFGQDSDYNMIVLLSTASGGYLLATIAFNTKDGNYILGVPNMNVFTLVDGSDVESDAPFPLLTSYTTGTPQALTGLKGVSTSGPYFMVYNASSIFITGYLYPNQAGQPSFSDWQYIYFIPGLFNELQLPVPFDGNKAKMFYIGSNDFYLAYSAGENSIVVLRGVYVPGSTGSVSNMTVTIPDIYTLVDFDFYMNSNGSSYSLFCRVILKQSTSPDSILLLLSGGDVIVMPGQLSDGNAFAVGVDYAAVFGETACS